MQPVATSAKVGPHATTCTRSWKAAVDGNWRDASKWTPRGVPTSNDDVCITHTGLYAVTLNHDASIRGLTLGAATGLQRLNVASECGAGSTLNIKRQSVSITTEGKLTIGQLGCATSANINFASTGTIVNHGQIELAANETDSNADIDNEGVVWLHADALWVGTNMKDNGLLLYDMPSGSAEMVLDHVSINGGLQIQKVGPNTGSGTLFADGTVSGHFTSYAGTQQDLNGLYIHECTCDGDFGLTTTRANVTASPSSGPTSTSVHLHGTKWPSHGVNELSFKDSAGTTTALGTITSSATFDVHRSVPAGAAAGAGKFIVENTTYLTYDTVAFTVS